MNFYSVGFIVDGRFEIPIQNFIDDLNATNSSRVRINFFSYNEAAVPKPDLDRMLSDLDEYISTANHVDNSTLNDTSYGIATLFGIKEFFLDEVLYKLY